MGVFAKCLYALKPPAAPPMSIAAAAAILRHFFHSGRLQTTSTPLTVCSVALGIAAVLFLALTGQTYAVALAFLLLLVKAAVLFKRAGC